MTGSLPLSYELAVAARNDEPMLSNLLEKAILAIDPKKAQAQLERQNDILKHQSVTDPLTGVVNRLKLDEAITAELRRARRTRQLERLYRAI